MAWNVLVPMHKPYSHIQVNSFWCYTAPLTREDKRNIVSFMVFSWKTKKPTKFIPFESDFCGIYALKHKYTHSHIDIDEINCQLTMTLDCCAVRFFFFAPHFNFKLSRIDNSFNVWNASIVHQIAYEHVIVYELLPSQFQMKKHKRRTNK